MKREESGPVPFDEKDLIHFKEGLFGFENYKRYLPVSIEEGSDAVLCLQSAEKADLSFIIMNPYYLCEEYHPQLTREEYEKLGTTKEEDLSFYVICVVADTLENSTVNLKCPVVVNAVTRQAVQVILESTQYHLRHTLSSLKREA